MFYFLFLVVSLLFVHCTGKNNKPPSLDTGKNSKEYFNNDHLWYEQNIPFFECSDKQIEQVYYYRWKLYKAHIRNVGKDEFVITEFINHVPWDREPYCTINAASMHHIYEGRWLKDDRYINGYINNLFQSVAITEATVKVLPMQLMQDILSMLIPHLLPGSSTA